MTSQRATIAAAKTWRSPGSGSFSEGIRGFVVGDEAIAGFRVHEVARPLQGSAVAMGFVAQKGLDPLAMNFGAPPGAKEVADGKLEEDIPHRRGIEHIRVKEGSVVAHTRS